MLKKVLIISSLAILIILSGCSKGSKLPKAPDFTLRSGDGDVYSLADFKGKMIILNFWATWCPPCKKEIPDFIDLYDQYQDKGLVILGVSVDQGGWMVTKEFRDKQKMNYPVVMASRDMLSQYGRPSSIPTTYIINSEGRIVTKFIGYRTRDVWEEQIKTVLDL